MEEQPDFARLRDLKNITEIVQGLDVDFEQMLKGLGPSFDDSLLLALSKTGLVFDDLPPEDISIISLTALGVGATRISRLLGCDRRQVYRTMQKSGYEEAMAIIRRDIGSRIFQWVLTYLPLAFEAVRLNLTTGDLDQKRKAAQVLFSLVKDSTAARATPPRSPRKPKVAPGTWALVEGD